MKFFDIPVRLDATLCAPGEVWLESPAGDAVRIWADDPEEPVGNRRPPPTPEERERRRAEPPPEPPPPPPEPTGNGDEF